MFFFYQEYLRPGSYVRRACVHCMPRGASHGDGMSHVWKLSLIFARCSASSLVSGKLTKCLSDGAA